MVQRTPAYIRCKPEIDPVAEFISKWLPAWLAVRINRWRAVLLGAYFYHYCLRFPDRAKRQIKSGMYKQVEGVMSKDEFERHFSPPYDPWQRRICFSPGSDLFGAIKSGKASVVTGQIDHFTEKGINMKGREHVEADFIITATGFTLQHNFPFSTMKVIVDEKEYRASEHLIYSGFMFSDVPNFAFIIGTQ